MKKNLIKITLGTGIALVAAFIYFTPIHANMGSAAGLCQNMVHHASNFSICEDGHMNCDGQHQMKTTTESTSSTQTSSRQNNRMRQDCNGTHRSQQKRYHQQGQHRGYHHS